MPLYSNWITKTVNMDQRQQIHPVRNQQLKANIPFDELSIKGIQHVLPFTTWTTDAKPAGYLSSSIDCNEPGSG